MAFHRLSNIWRGYIVCICVPCLVSQHLEDVDVCSEKCSDEDMFSTEAQFQFTECLERCANQRNSTWPLQNGSTHCHEDFVDGNPVCSAKHIAVTFTPLLVLSEWRQHIVVFWKPCAVGLADVQGYQIELYNKDTAGSYVDCKQVMLSRTLNHTDVEFDLAVIFTEHLEYNTKYEIAIVGLPRVEHSIYSTLEFVSDTCNSLNGNFSCHCGLESAPMPNITTQGYRLWVTIPTLDPCFNIRKYELILGFVMESDSRASNRRIREIKRKFIYARDSMVQSFYPLYLNSANSNYIFKYRALDGAWHHADSEKIAFHLTDWAPTKPNITAVDELIEISWVCAPDNYNITQYQVKVSCNKSRSTGNETYENVYNIKAHCSEGIMSIKSILHQYGSYSSQIREWRDPIHESEAKWSAKSGVIDFVWRNTSSYKDSNRTLIAVMVSIGLLLILLATGLLCLKKRNFRHKVLNLPTSMNWLIGLHSSHTHVCKTVWVVWQADYYDSLTGDVHAENIRHLSAFLANHCSLNVILDQYEVTSAPSLTTWLKEKQRQADVVLFVCPHNDVSHHFNLHELCGNFLSVYNMYESELLCEESSVKFASAVLPYSRLEVYDHAKLLLRKMPSFRLMEEIDSLYFFIQNCGLAGRHGKYVVKYVNKHDYAKTEEGDKIKKGFMKMQKLLAGEDKSDPSLEGSSLSGNLQDGEASTCDNAEQSTFSSSTNEFKPIPPPSIVLEEDADRAVYLLNTSGLLSQQPIESDLVEAFTLDSQSLLLPKNPYMNDSF